MPSAPSNHSLNTMPDLQENEVSSFFPPYHDDSAGDGTTISAEESALSLPSSDDEIDSGSDTASDIAPHRLKRSWLRRLHPRIRKTGKWAVRWTKGPDPPQIYQIKPIFPTIQEVPIKLLDRYFPKRKHKISLLVLFYSVWFLTFALVLRGSSFSTTVPGYGAPETLQCTSRYWSKGNECGLDGDQCRPFSNTTLAFRCPANCLGVRVLNPHAVGDQYVNYRPLVIGGPTDSTHSTSSAYYRGDSFICGSAIHSGFLSDAKGGCGALSLVGEKRSYASTTAHGIASVGFDSYFPQSFTFLDGTQTQCEDLRWPLLGVSLTFTILLSLFTTSPGIFFWSLFVGLFFHVSLVSDPPSYTDYSSLVSVSLGRFLPATFCAYVIYKFCTIRQLKGLTAQFEKTVLWLGACWVGCLNNYTFDNIPIQRLTPSDLKAQPGAISALIIIVLTIFAIALGQAWAIRREGRMRLYLVIYGIFLTSLLALVAIPKMVVRIHHYILGLLLVPGTAVQNRPSLVFQGLLVGLFINGIARWGFDSILQTPGELLGDAQRGTPLPALVIPPIVQNNFGTSMPGNITFDFSRLNLPRSEGYDGLCVLVNDVERFKAYEGGIYGGDTHVPVRNFTWVRHHEGVPEYFRLAFVKDGTTGDYTKAGIWGRDGGWTNPKSGPSR